jgi:cytochrome c556
MTPTSYRQNIMMGFQQNQAALTNIRNGTVGAQANILNRAIILQQLALSLTDAFPPNSIGEGSRALPAIWTNAADFTTKVNAIQTAATALVEAARGGNAQTIAAAQMTFNGTCASCHMTYRGPAPPGN